MFLPKLLQPLLGADNAFINSPNNLIRIRRNDLVKSKLIETVIQLSRANLTAECDQIGSCSGNIVDVAQILIHRHFPKC